MELRNIPKRTVVAALRLNGTRPELVEHIEQQMGKKHLRWAADGKWTILVCGDTVGVAKRATYARMADEESVAVGLSIAASRL